MVFSLCNYSFAVPVLRKNRNSIVHLIEILRKSVIIGIITDGVYALPYLNSKYGII